jgi:hypothetical protein
MFYEWTTDFKVACKGEGLATNGWWGCRLSNGQPLPRGQVALAANVGHIFCFLKIDYF